jgi:hypothetical protein
MTTRLKFACPHCQAILNPGERLVFAVRHGDLRGLMLMRPRLGDYRFDCDNSFAEQVSPGDVVDFACPVCQADLAVPSGERFAEVLLHNADEQVKRVRFSRRCGEHATFTHDGQEVTSYGEHAAVFEHLDFSETDSWW